MQRAALCAVLSASRSRGARNLLTLSQILRLTACLPRSYLDDDEDDDDDEDEHEDEHEDDDDGGGRAMPRSSVFRLHAASRASLSSLSTSCRDTARSLASSRNPSTKDFNQGRRLSNNTEMCRERERAKGERTREGEGEENF